MKRNNDLIRAILAEVEKHKGGNRTLSLSKRQFVDTFPGLDADTLNGHIQLLKEVGFVEAAPHQFGWSIVGLTWSGHDFLTDSKCPNIWERAKQVGGDLSFDVFRSALKDAALKAIQGVF